ncbi:tetratricopeptide repeat protein [Bacillus mycoides]
MRIQGNKVDYGKLLFYFRTKKKMTQQELSAGICSIPYLSKVENSKITPSNEILALLLKRVNICIDNLNSDKGNIVIDLERWYEAIIKREESIVIDQLKNTIDSKIGNVYLTDIIFYYDLISLRYFIHKKCKKNIVSIIDTLFKNKDKLNNYQRTYLEYFLGLYHCTIDYDFLQGIEKFEKVIHFFNNPENEDPEFFFHLALTYTNIFNTKMALVYVEKSLAIFNNKLFFNRSLECHLLLGVNYGRLKEYSKAIEIYNRIINVANSLEYRTIYIKALHNLGYIYSKLKNYEESISYYTQTLNYLDSTSESYLNVLVELATVLKEHGQLQTALKWINIGLEQSSKNCWTSNKVLQLEIIKYRIEKTDIEFIEFLEKNAIPRFIETNDIKLLSHFYEVIGKESKKIHQYKKSSYYYELCFDLRKKMN